MSAKEYGLGRDFEGEQREAEIADLFRAHTSPAFTRLAATAAGVSPGGEPAPSLATCEKVPTSDEDLAREQPEEYRYVERMTVAAEAIRASVSRSRDRQRKVLALIEAGEPAHAKRLANCRRQSVELKCPTMAGGCGRSGNYVPINCDSRLCPDCMNRKMGKVANQYAAEVAGWDHATMFRLSLPERVEPERLETAVDALRGAFGRLRRRVIQPDGEHDGTRWVWSGDGGEPARYHWKRALRASGRTDLARRWQKRYVNQGKGIPFEEIVATGFYGIDVKQGDDGTLNVHMHVLANCPYLPQAALSAEWDDIIGAPAVDIRRIEERGEKDAESALMEVVGYAAKAPEFNQPEVEAEYLAALKGSKLIQPFGDLHGNTPDAEAALRCCHCETEPAWWNYEGVVDECYETAVVGGSADGDRPPP